MSNFPKAFQAWSKHGNRVSNTPRAAALAFFEAFPKARTCTVSQGQLETRGGQTYFVTVYNPQSKRYPDTTRKNAATLPDDKPA